VRSATIQTVFPWLTLALVAANAVIFIVTSGHLVPMAHLELIDAGGLVPSRVVENGETWRLVTASFVHVDALHLVQNLLAILALGVITESVLGRINLFTIYVTSGIVGAATSCLCGGGAMSAGASGAVFGMMGGAVAAYLSAGDISERPRIDRVTLGVLTLAMGVGLVAGMLMDSVDTYYHVGGLLGGFVVALALGAGSRPSRTGRRIGVAAFGLCLSVVIVSAVMVFGHDGQPATASGDSIAVRAD
jgi:rhomboid protease GluP